jgi:hypothetical protein
VQAPATPSIPPRRRLSEIFAEIAADAVPVATPEEIAAPEPPRRHRRHRVRSNITVGEVVDRTARSGFGFIIAFLALCSTPFPGLSVPFGAMIVVGAVQMILGFERPWLPRRIRRIPLALSTLRWLAPRLSRGLSWLEKIARPRFPYLTRGVFLPLCGVAIIVQAVGLSLPLPIPGSNLFFIIPILLYAIALLESDGLLISLAHTITLYQVVLAIRTWERIAGFLADHWASITGFFHRILDSIVHALG